ncbi:hypothetical protein C9374_010073 [Naegleria lovaniensis]|uniref:Uncharacterized protein n=1 Tax=Naegleria lovaniensis TaxID=51637 RepID=A0AA88GGW9_NAELO|nr:uncharacterized protein C9374_010073 [Naegleria lovaniensis]KAG2375069.1 hypothetical protein C9374_010073 [Naegleria lovaniensis]
MMRASISNNNPNFGPNTTMASTTLSSLKGGASSGFSSVGELQAFINYNCRRKYYSSVTEVCELFLTRGEDPIVRLWNSFGHCMQGNLSEAIRGYNMIKERKEVQLASYIGLVAAHEQSANQDEQEIETLKTFIEMERGSAQNSAKLQAALLYLHMGEYDECRNILEDIDEKYKDPYTNLETVKAWATLLDDEIELVNCESLFDACIKADPRNLDAMMGKAKNAEKQRKIQQAIDICSQISLSFQNFSPAQVEKCLLLIQLDDWDQCRETALRIQKQDPNNVDAMYINLLYLFVKGSQYEDLVNQFNELFKVITKREAKNDKLCSSLAKTFSSLSEGKEELLKKCIDLLNLAKKANPIEADYFILQGHIQVMMKDFINAETSFRKALELNDGSISANKGLFKCSILQNKKDVATQYRDFLGDIEVIMEEDDDAHEESAQENKSELLFLMALYEHRCNKNVENFTKSLSDVYALHEKELRSMKKSIEYYGALNPQFILEICHELIRSIPSEPLGPTDPQTEELALCSKILTSLTSEVPGLMLPQLLLAKTKFIMRDFESAQRILARVLQYDPKSSQAHILLAQIAYYQENYTLATTELERAVSYDFAVTKQADYNLLKAKVLASKGETKDAIQNLERILKAEAIQRKISDDEIISIYLELSAVHSRRNEHVEAAKYIEQALEKFAGTEQEGRIIIANAKLSISRNDSDTAISILQSVQPESSYYLLAKSEIAKIYLNRNDKRSYAKCYEELVEKSIKTSSSYLFLGDAYMKIQEPEKAIEAYQEALSIDPKNLPLRNKIAKSLILVHNYEEAVSFYKEAIELDQNNIDPRYDLAQLYLKLRKFKEAERTLTETVSVIEGKKSNQISLMSQYVKVILLLSQVHCKMGDLKVAMSDLEQAKNMQVKILSKLQNSQQDSLYLEKQIAAKICYELGDYNRKSGDSKTASQFFKEALQYDEAHESSMLALAEIYLKDNDIEGCQSQCTSLLRVNKSHEQATIMMADIMFRNNKFEEAIEHFQTFLHHKPNNYKALVQLLTLLRRAGKLDEAETFLKEARNFSPKEEYDPGFNFCNGLFHLYRNNSRESLVWFNRARKSGDWGEMATVYMIETYLNPDTTVDSSLSESDQKEKNPKTVVSENRMESITAAERLLEELTTTTISPHKKKTLQGYLKIAKCKTKDEIEKCIPFFGEVLSQDTDYVPALVALSYAFEKTKQTPKARQTLKRISKMGMKPGWEDDFERGWLLLADIYIGNGKFDLAQELIKKILEINKSCTRAWELDGLIYEKEGSFQDAANCYEKAWKLSGETSPSSGYKLAFNLLKAKRNIEAINVCHKVLQKHPNYPKIKKEVLDKARLSIRP